jgi:N-acetyl-ornithine/N-acetyl-lysine deacetylase
LIREVRGRGLLIGIELTRRVQPYLETLCERGVLALPAGSNVLRLLPPLVITEEQLGRVLDIVEELLTGAGAKPTPSTIKQVAFRDAISSAAEASGQGQALSLRTMGCEMSTAEREQLRSRACLGGDEIEVALLQQMLTIPSLSCQESALAHFLVEQARALGLHAYVDEVGNFVASTHEALPTAPDAQPIILLGHMDTVPGNIPVTLSDGILYGRGAVDAKGPLAAFICATARVASRRDLARPIVVIGAVEEEAATSKGARGVVDRYRPAACIIGEPSGSQAVTIGYKGRLLVDGWAETQLSHSAGPLQSSSEVATAFWEQVRRHAVEWNAQHAGDSAFASLQPGLRSIQNEQDGLIDRTRFSISYRLPPRFDCTELRNQLTRWADEAHIQISFTGEEVAYQSTRTTELARSFIAALRATGVQSSFKLKTGTSDMNVVGPTWGKNIVAYGPGDSRLDHTPQEHIRITEYTHAIDVLEFVLKDWAQQRETAV